MQRADRVKVHPCSIGLQVLWSLFCTSIAVQQKDFLLADSGLPNFFGD